MHTNNEDSPWWEVDLKEVYDISHMSIYNRIEYPDRTKDVYLFISANPFKSDEISILKEEPGVTTYHIKEQVEFPTKVNVDCKARYVRVQLANHGFLNLAEVEVYGKPAQDIQDLVLVENVALNKPAKQSSVGWGGEPEHGVDGNRDGRSLNSIFHTQKEQSPWWEVDLEETYDITRIALFNRVEAAQRVERAQNLYVFVSKEPFKSHNLEDIKNQSNVLSFHIEETVNYPSFVEVNATGRYIRVQLVERTYLHLAQVEVYATSFSQTSSSSQKPGIIIKKLDHIDESESDADKSSKTDIKKSPEEKVDHSVAASETIIDSSDPVHQTDEHIETESVFYNDLHLKGLAESVIAAGVKAELIGVAEVCPDSTQAVIGDVVIEFGEYNLEETTKLEVSRYPEQSDQHAGINAQPYQITIANTTEFPTMVEVTLPYDDGGLSSADLKSAISVAWLDRENKSWRLIPSQVNVEKNSVTFRTNHFSVFTVLRNDLVKGKTLFYYPDDIYRGPETPLLVDIGVLQNSMDHIDTSPFQTLISRRAEPTNGYFSTAMDLVNTLSSGGSYAMDFNMFARDHFRMVTALRETVGNAFTYVGAAAVAPKIADQWNRGVSSRRIIRDNAFSLLELVGAGIFAVKSSPFVTVCATGIWTAGIIESITTTNYLNRTKDTFDLLHNRFNMQKVLYHSRDKRWSYFVTKPGGRRPSHEYRVMNTDRAWGTEIYSIYQANRNNPERIQPEVERFVNDFSDVFWRIVFNPRRKSDILYWADQSNLLVTKCRYFGNTIHSQARKLKWPDNFQDTLKYREICRERVHNRLLPIYRLIAEHEQQEIMDAFVRRMYELARTFNQVVVFEIHDPALEQPGFAKSARANKVFRLNASGEHAKDFELKERHNNSNRVFACTVFHYMLAGSPNELLIYSEGTKSDSSKVQFKEETVKFTFSIPTTVITLPSDSRFTIDSKTKVITDHKTGLQWFAYNDHPSFTWYQANKWAKELSVDGGGWRLATRSELQALHPDAHSGVGYPTYPMLADTFSSWTSEQKDARTSDVYDDSSAWIAHLHNGELTYDSRAFPFQHLGLLAVR